MEQHDSNTNIHTTSVSVEDMNTADQTRLMLLLLQDIL